MTAPAPFDPIGLDRLAHLVDDFVNQGRFAGGVVLLNVGDETWMHAAGVQDLASEVPMAPDSIFRIASMSKALIAAATMLLVDDGRLDLDAPVDPWLPELANRQVVLSITGPLDDTVPAEHPITTRHLLTLTWGLGLLMMEPGQSPLHDAMTRLGVSVEYFPAALEPDAYMSAIGSLPLAHQPGEGWLYHTGYDILPILLARVTGQPVADFMRERLFDPLGMVDTSFWMPEDKLDRFTTVYAPGEAGLTVLDPAVGGFWSERSHPPIEVVSTAGDFLAFARMLLAGGRASGRQILSPGAVHEMTRDHLTPAIKRDFPLFPGYWDTHGWGYGVAMHTTDPVDRGFGRGTYGWSGGFNTHWQSDPTRDFVGLILFQRVMGDEENGAIIDDIWQHALAALSDPD